jgi:hypothetical protein
MNTSNFNLAMTLSDGIFAYFLCGVMTSLFESGAPCPNPDDEALAYMKIHHADALAKEDADANNETPNHLLS